MLRWLCLAVAASVGGSLSRADEPARRLLTYAPAPVDNPLKGLVPYAADVRSLFPHSLEFDYLPLSAVVTGPGRYDWGPFERMLERIAVRGHQAVVRFFLEYPGKKEGIPPFLIAGGLKVHVYQNTNTQPLPPAESRTPNYEDANLRRVLREFVAAFGRKYDGDPRLGFVTAGLLGTWGEWHTYPKSELFASKAVQTEVLDAYEAAFTMTPVLLRYPAGDQHYAHAPNARRRLGYHDDSFAWSTLDTGKKEDDWYFVPALRAAGALDKWRTQPIGGEIRPEAWGKVFDADPGVKDIQNFRRCVAETHASWLLDSGMFEKKQSAERIRRAEADVRRMGYEFHAKAVTVGRPAGGPVSVAVEIENRGVAPFYYDWPAEFGLLDGAGQRVKSYPVGGKLTGLLPGDQPRVWCATLELAGVPAGRYQLTLRVPNKLPNGHPLRFANAEQDANAKGWLTLGTVEVAK